MKKYLTEKVDAALKSLSYGSVAKLTFDKPKDETHGDITTNIAMLLAKSVKKNPRAVAQEIISKLEVERKYVSKIEIAGPGFINFRFTDEFFTAQIGNILKHAESFGKIDVGEKTEFNYVDQARLLLNDNDTVMNAIGEGSEIIKFGKQDLSVWTYLRRFRLST